MFENNISDKNMLKINELRLKKIFIFLGAAACAGLFMFQILNHIYFTGFRRFMGFIALVFVAITILFLKLRNKMKKYHNFEYDENSKPMCTFFFAILFSIMLNLVNCEFSYWVQGNPWDLEQLGSMCLERKFIGLFYIKVVIGVIMPQNLVIIMAIIICKKPDDILQGVSKLDYLLKVSMF